MPVEQVTVPAAGESITEATLNRWFKPDGAFVKADEPLFEMGTDKASQEVVAPVSGVVKHLVKEGETVAIGKVVAQIDTDAKAPAESPKAAPKQEAKSEPKPAQKQEAIASPAAQRVLAEAGVKAEEVKGTGRDGRITKEDAVAAATKPTQSNGAPAKPETKQEKPAPRAPGTRITREPISKIRKTIATR